MPLRALVVAWVLLALAGGRAEAVDITAPPDRFAGPGEYVTLVFRLASAEALEVDVSVATERGWPILRQPGTVRLEPGRSTPVVATVEVPADAPAFAGETVRFTVVVDGARVERRVVLSVTELVDLALEAPREFTLGTGELTVTVINGGNAPDEVTIDLRRGSAIVASQTLSVAAGSRVDLAFALDDDGTHTVTLTSARGVELRRSVSVLRFGVRPPEPFALAAVVSASATTTGALRSTFTVKGALSDFATLDARFDAPNWRRSYAQVNLEGGLLRVGAGGRDPFGLGLPSGFGVAGVLRRDAWSVAASAGQVGDDRFAATVAGSWRDGPLTVAGGAGVTEGTPVVALRVAREASGGDWDASATWDRQGLALGVRGEIEGVTAAVPPNGALTIASDDASEVRPGSAGDGVLDLRVDARGLGTDRARLDLGVRYRAGRDVVYADAGGGLGAGIAWSGRFGVTTTLTADLPGTWRASAQVGSGESFAQLANRIDLGAGWHTAQTLGVRLDERGFALTLDAGAALSGGAYLAADARLVLRPATGLVEGRVGARAQAEFDAWTLSGAVGWDVGDRALGLGAGAAWSAGSWRVDLETSLGYATASAEANRWNGSATLSAAYAFTLAVPDDVADAFGGRRVGTVVGRLSVDDDADATATGRPAAGAELAGMVVEVGRYRVLVGDDGTFSVDLPPGRYPASIVVATLPVAYRLLDPARTEVEVRLRETVEATWRIARTTVLSGRVLEDRDGDGVADDPPRGVAARVLLTDAEGLRRVLATDADGAFSARGLVPGEAEVLLLDAPAGATLVGEARRRVRLASGSAAEVEFLVRPVEVVARSFAPQALRIRGATPEAERVPPGAAPLLRVQVQGDARAVEVETPAGTVPLARAGDAWVGRVPVPLDAPPGVFAITMVARGDEGEATRRGQLLVDPDAPVVQLATDAPVRPGGELRVTLTAYLEAASVIVATPFGGPVRLDEVEPGRWQGVVAVPADAEDAVHVLAAEVATADGRVLGGDARFRVLVR